MKFKSFVIAVLALSLTMVSCSDKDDTPTQPGESIPQELVDTWLYQSASINDVPVGLALVLQWQPETESAIFTVGSDESFIYEELHSDGTNIWTEIGTIEINGDNATITVTEDTDGPVAPPDILDGSWSLDGDILSLSTTLESLIVVMTAVRLN